MNFVVIDVETANPDLSSICQIGIACFHDGKLDNSWGSLVNPEDEFDPIHVSIHGIDEEKVRDCPNWPALYPEVRRLLQGNIVASHMAFDRVALRRACERYRLADCEYRWIDSAMVVRRAWPIFSHSGYALANVAAEFGIEYRAHDALQDACCAGEVLLRAITESGLSIDAWLERVKQPISLPVHPSPEPVRTSTEPTSPRPPRASLTPPVRIVRDANPEGPLFGEVLVFTGALSIPRHEAADAASVAGCEVTTSVSKHTTLLVVGDQDVRKLAGCEKSSKYRKAEELIAKGQNIRVITESDFRSITDPASR